MDTINFDLGDAPATITLASQLPNVTDVAGLTVDGADSGITISGADQVRVFEVTEGATLALNRLTVAEGNSATGLGGGVLNRGNLAVSGSTFSGNGAASGGAIANSGTATVTMTRSTLSDNTASGSGGGIHNLGTLRVTGSTLSGNGAASGDGIHNGAGDTSLRNTIVANIPSGGDCSIGGGTISDGGYNLSLDRTCGLSAVNRSRPGVDPVLGPLVDNGGPTQTHALPENSPAVDKGRSFGMTADQRDLPRPTDLGPVNNARGGDGSDIGAYEQVRCSGGVVNAPGTIVGTPRGDDLSGGTDGDFIFGLGGNDRITGGGGNDEVCSGKGNDTISGGGGDDTLLGGEGKDKLQAAMAATILEGLLGDDTLNTIDNVPANDVANGGPGSDVCRTEPNDRRVSCR